MNTLLYPADSRKHAGGYTVHVGQAVGLLRGPAALLCCCGGGGGRSDTTSSTTTQTVNKQFGVSDQAVGLAAEGDLSVLIQSIDPATIKAAADVLQAMAGYQADVSQTQAREGAALLGSVSSDLVTASKDNAALLSSLAQEMAGVTSTALTTGAAVNRVAAEQQGAVLASLTELGKTTATGGGSDVAGALKTLGVAAAAALAVAFLVSRRN